MKNPDVIVNTANDNVKSRGIKMKKIAHKVLPARDYIDVQREIYRRQTLPTATPYPRLIF